MTRVQSFAAPLTTEQEVVTQLAATFETPPDFAVLAFPARCDAARLHQAFRQVAPECVVLGTSVCRAVLTEQGHHPDSVGALLVWDEDGDYGVAWGKELEQVAQVARQAASSADRPGEVPQVLLAVQHPGAELDVLRSLQGALGEQVPLFGGSAADDRVEGQWGLLSPDAAYGFAALYPGSDTLTVFDSGYQPAGFSGEVTRSEGRRILEIDGQPAGTVYAGWADLPLRPGDNILLSSALQPLGVARSRMGTVDLHTLVHPSGVGADHALETFGEVFEGERVELMRSDPDTLVRRTGGLAHRALEGLSGAPAGALVVFCGGTMMAIEGHMDRVACGLAEALCVPFLGLYTFGEAGTLAVGLPQHGNLMAGMTVWGRE